MLNKGDIITFGTSVAIAFYLTISAIAMKKGADPIVLTFNQMWIVAVLSIICGLISRENMLNASPAIYITMIYLGIFPAALGFLIQNSMLNKVNLVVASILLSTEFLFGMIFSWIFGYEPFQAIKIVGAIMVLSAIVLPDAFQKFGLSKP